MVIGFDIDNTMTSSKETANKYYANYEFKEDGDSYTQMPECKRKVFVDKYLIDIIENAPLKEGVVEVFNYLKSKNHKIILITRRGYKENSIVKDITLKKLKNWNLLYDEIHFEVEDKGVLAKEKNVSLFVDDHTFNLEAVARENIDVIRFGKSDNNDYEIVEDWYSLLELLKKKGF